MKSFEEAGLSNNSYSNEEYRGSSLIRNSPPPQGHHRALGIVLL